MSNKCIARCTWKPTSQSLIPITSSFRLGYGGVSLKLFLSYQSLILITSPFRSFHWSVLIPFFHCIPILFAQVVHVTVLPFNPIQLVVVNMLWLIVSIYSIWSIDGQVLVTPSRGSVMVLLMCTCWVIIPVWVLLSVCFVPFVLVRFYDGEMYSAPNENEQALQWKGRYFVVLNNSDTWRGIKMK